MTSVILIAVAIVLQVASILCAGGSGEAAADMDKGIARALAGSSIVFGISAGVLFYIAGSM